MDYAPARHLRTPRSSDFACYFHKNGDETSFSGVPPFALSLFF